MDLPNVASIPEPQVMPTEQTITTSTISPKDELAEFQQFEGVLRAIESGVSENVSNLNLTMTTTCDFLKWTLKEKQTTSGVLLIKYMLQQPETFEAPETEFFELATKIFSVN